MTRPTVLIIGDSISMGYHNGVVEALSERANVVRIEENGGTSRNIRQKVAGWVERAHPHSVLLNCGLHDIAMDAGKTTNRVPVEEYADNLREIVSWFRANSRCRLLWARTTPVIYERHHTVKGFDRDDRDVRRYNASADTVMRQAGVECLDLYAVIQQGGVEDCLGADGVHMTDKGNRVLAEAVAAAIENALGECKD